MANAPEYQSQVTPDPGALYARPPRIVRPPVDNTGAALERMGSATDQVVGVLGARERYLQNEADQKAVADAHLAAATAAQDMTQHLSDVQAAAPDDPTGTTKQFLDGYDDYAEKAIQQTSNTKGKAALQLLLAGQRTHFLTSSLAWEAHQTARYNGDRIDNATQAYGKLLATDDTAYEPVRDAMMAMVDSSKLPPDLREHYRDRVNVGLNAAAAEGFIARNPRFAQGAINRRLGIPAVEDAPQSHPISDQPQSDTSAQIAPSGPIAPATDRLDALLGAAVKQESGGQHLGPDGKLLTSSAGAQGVTQVMPATGKDPGYGVKPLQNNSRDEYLRFGRDYLGAMLQAFDGDQDKALAAYNAGPGRVQKAIATGGSAWLAQLPPETQHYVRDVGADYRTRMAAIATPTMIASNTANGLVDVPTPTPVSTLDPIEVTKKIGVPFLDQMAVPELLKAKTHADELVRKDQADAQAEVRAALHNAGAQAERGVVPNTPDPTLVMRATGTPGKAQEVLAQFDNLRTFGSTISRVQTMTPAEMSQAAVTLSPLGKDDPEWQAKAQQRDGFIKAASAVVKARQDDPMRAALDQGIASIQPLDFSDPASAGRELAQRQAVAVQMRDRYGAPTMSALTKDEAKAYGENFHRQTTSAQLDTLTALRTSLTDPRVYRASVSAFAKDSPVTLAAADLATRDSANRAPDGTPAHDVAYGLLEGERLLNPDRAAKQEDGKGGTYKLPPTGGSAGMDAYLGDKLGEAFMQDAGGFDRAKQAVYAYYAHLSARDGKFAEAAYDEGRLDKAIDATLGATSKWSTGVFTNQRVLMPWGMSDEEFRPSIASAYQRAMTSAGLAGTVMDKPENMNLIRLDEYRYGLRAGAAAMKDRSGRPLVLDLTPIDAQP